MTYIVAGPAEVLVVADDAADPYTCATDLLSQADHGPNTPAILITTSEEVAKQTIDYVDKLLLNLPTSTLASTSWLKFGEVTLENYLAYHLHSQEELSSIRTSYVTNP